MNIQNYESMVQNCKVNNQYYQFMKQAIATDILISQISIKIQFKTDQDHPILVADIVNNVLCN